MAERPVYWKTRLDEIEEVVQSVKIGKSRVLGYSAGNRKIWLVEYGEKQDFKRMANYNSACGAKNPIAYADKRGAKPVLLMAGAIHGSEMEGIVGILNFINILETGCDFRGQRWDFLYDNRDNFRILLIPCLNPDGRARFPFDICAGVDPELMGDYGLGTWKDGTPARWPKCKEIHPVLEHSQLLGCYYNDDGVNLMHDNFFNPMANETKLILNLADEEAPDFTVLLHGGGNYHSHIKQTSYVPLYIKKQAYEFEKRLYDSLAARGIPHEVQPVIPVDGEEYPPPSFNLCSAIHHVCGGISVLFESNTGLAGKGLRYTTDQILNLHLVLFEEMMKFVATEVTAFRV